ncbi:hypothetical protein [Mycoplasma capricolum]|uniref:hypothetical protein n=1 Tax=Mycoplasma capricolum TaxID=2095 RepID=UPI001FB6F6F3|nr:hypothetical protein [Mycoplasma capricolum]
MIQELKKLNQSISNFTKQLKQTKKEQTIESKTKDKKAGIFNSKKTIELDTQKANLDVQQTPILENSKIDKNKFNLFKKKLKPGELATPTASKQPKQDYKTKAILSLWKDVEKQINKTPKQESNKEGQIKKR